jgi:hypothetical protein
MIILNAARNLSQQSVITESKRIYDYVDKNTAFIAFELAATSYLK